MMRTPCPHGPCASAPVVNCARQHASTRVRFMRRAPCASDAIGGGPALTWDDASVVHFDRRQFRELRGVSNVGPANLLRGAIASGAVPRAAWAAAARRPGGLRRHLFARRSKGRRSVCPEACNALEVSQALVDCLYGLHGCLARLRIAS